MAIKRKSILGFGIILILLPLLVGQAWAVEPQPQNTFATPTPRESGEIIYKVQEGENCLGIYIEIANGS